MSSPPEDRSPSAANRGGRRLRTWLFGFLAAAALTAAVLHFGDLQRFSTILQEARPQWLAVALALQLATYWANASAWRAVLRAAGHHCALAPLMRIAISKLFADQAVPTGGMSGNVLLIDQLILLGVPRGVASAALILSIVGYYMAYAICTFAAFALLSINQEASPALLLALTAFLGLAAAIPAAALWLARRGGNALAGRLRQIGWLAGMLETIGAAPDNLLRDRVLVAKVAGCNLTVFVADALTLWVCLHALGLAAAPWKAFVTLVLASIVATIGPVPMGIGTFEATSTGTLSMLGITAEGAFSATMLLRIVTLWLPLLLGLILVRSSDKQPA